MSQQNNYDFTFKIGADTSDLKSEILNAFSFAQATADKESVKVHIDVEKDNLDKFFRELGKLKNTQVAKIMVDTSNLNQEIFNTEEKLKSLKKAAKINISGINTKDLDAYIKKYTEGNKTIQKQVKEYQKSLTAKNPTWSEKAIEGQASQYKKEIQMLETRNKLAAEITSIKGKSNWKSETESLTQVIEKLNVVKKLNDELLLSSTGKNTSMLKGLSNNEITKELSPLGKILDGETRKTNSAITDYRNQLTGAVNDFKNVMSKFSELTKGISFRDSEMVFQEIGNSAEKAAQKTLTAAENVKKAQKKVSGSGTVPGEGIPNSSFSMTEQDIQRMIASMESMKSTILSVNSSFTTLQATSQQFGHVTSQSVQSVIEKINAMKSALGGATNGVKIAQIGFSTASLQSRTSVRYLTKYIEDLKVAQKGMSSGIDDIKLSSTDVSTSNIGKKTKTLTSLLSSLQKIPGELSSIETAFAAETDFVEMAANYQVAAINKITAAITNLKKEVGQSGNLKIKIIDETANSAKNIRNKSSLAKQYYEELATNEKARLTIRNDESYAQSEKGQTALIKLRREKLATQEKINALGLSEAEIISRNAILEEKKAKVVQRLNNENLKTSKAKEKSVFTPSEEYQRQISSYEKTLASMNHLASSDGFSNSFKAQIDKQITSLDSLKAKLIELDSMNVDDPINDASFQSARREIEKFSMALETELNSLKKNKNSYSRNKGKDKFVTELQPGLGTQESIEALKAQAAALDEGTLLTQRYDKAQNKLIATYKTSAGTIQKVALSYDSLSGITRKSYGTETKYINSFSEGMDRLKGKFIEFGKYAIASVSFYQVINFFRRGVGVVNDLNKAMTELKKTSDGSVKDYATFLKDVQDSSMEVGSTSQTLVESAADWSRLGYDLDGSAVMAKNTAILENVSEYESISDATDALVSIMQGFNIQADDAMAGIIDKVNMLGNNYASSTSDLTDAMMKSSSALVAAGNSIDESLALTVAANGVVKLCHVSVVIQKLVDNYISQRMWLIRDLGKTYKLNYTL
nr:MAG TPA: minor tail protein [Caudoviricetes sp.]